AAMCVMIWLRATFHPSLVYEAGASDVGAKDADSMSASRTAILLSPAISLVILVLGGIYGGWFTPTEGGAVGSAGALLYALARSRIDAKEFRPALVECVQISTTVLFLILSAIIFTIMPTSSGFVQSVGAYVSGLGLVLWHFAVIHVILPIVLGMFLESGSIMLIVVPIALPTAIALGGDSTWFGILTVIGVEIGLLAPPFALTCFAVASTLRGTGIALRDIFLGALPFVWVMAIVTILLIPFSVLGTLTP
ncbi:MAG: TRAP transporter large permease subunit, partial [Albidovulum sp.]|nr:TRAP transporter large permease subunit [Albidovulum sp.]